jgi:hypothetical protein
MATLTTAAARTTSTATAERGRRRLATAALTAAALLACACGGAGERPAAAATPGPAFGPASPEALAAVRSAVAATLAGTATVTIALTGSTVFDRNRSKASATGAFDFRAMRGAISLTPAGSRVTEPVVFTPSAVYIRPPAANELLPKGKTWIVDSFTDTPAVTANFPQFVAQVESVNPGLILSELAWGATAAAAAVSQGAAGGPAPPAYDVTVDLRQALAGAGGPAAIPFAVVIETEGVTATTMHVSAWLAASGGLARVELRPPGTGLGTVGVTLNGPAGPVSAGPPPASQAVELAALAPAGERENKNGGDSDGG